MLNLLKWSIFWSKNEINNALDEQEEDYVIKDLEWVNSLKAQEKLHRVRKRVNWILKEKWWTTQASEILYELYVKAFYQAGFTDLFFKNPPRNISENVRW